MGRDHLPVQRSAQQRNQDGGGARSLSLHPVSSDRRRTGREMDLLRGCHGAARPADRQGHRGEADGLCATRPVRSARARARRMVDRSQRRAARRLGRAPASTRSVARRPDGAGERRLAGQADRAGRVAQAVDDSRRHHRGPAPLRLALVSRRASRRHAASPRTHDQRHRLGRAAPVPRAGARPRGRHECRQLPPADPGTGAHRRRADHRPGAARPL